MLANQRRSAGRRSRLDGTLRTQTTLSADDTAQVAARREEHRELHKALRLLSELDRELVTMIAWEGLTPTQVAAALRLRPTVVRVRLHRARARLRRALEHTGHTSTTTPPIPLPEADHATCS